ncbi:MAG: G5 domain-containing protein [Butyricicoccaceae bacterium]
MGRLKKQMNGRITSLAIFLIAGVITCVLAGAGRETYELTDGTTSETITCFEDDPYAVLAYSEQFSEEQYYVPSAPEEGFAYTDSGAVKIPVCEKFVVKLTADGETSEQLCGEMTVQELLEQSGITLGEDDLVEPGLHKQITKAGTVKVTRVTSTVKEVESKIEFKTEKKKNDDLEYGTEKTVQKGKNGTLWQKVEIIYHDGQEFERKVLEEKTLEEPVNEIIEQGTARMIDGHRYKEKYTMEATAYHTGSITALGFIGYEGVVAVDPSVIPLGSRVYIEGYGEGYAADTGGSIKGYRIDLCMASYQRIDEFGRRNITVYLLE